MIHVEEPPTNINQQLSDVADAYVNAPKYLEMLAAAYHRATDIPPENCVLICREMDGETGYYYARILSVEDDGDLNVERVPQRGLLRRLLRRWLEALW